MGVDDGHEDESDGGERGPLLDVAVHFVDGDSFRHSTSS